MVLEEIPPKTIKRSSQVTSSLLPLTTHIMSEVELPPQNGGNQGDDIHIKISPSCDICFPIPGAYSLGDFSDEIQMLNYGEEVIRILDTMRQNILPEMVVSLMRNDVYAKCIQVVGLNVAHRRKGITPVSSKPTPRHPPKLESRCHDKDVLRFHDAIHKKIKENDSLRLEHLKQEREIKVKKREIKELKVRMTFLEKEAQQTLKSFLKKRMSGVKMEMASKNVEIQRMNKEMAGVKKAFKTEKLKAEKLMKRNSAKDPNGEKNKARATAESYQREIKDLLQTHRDLVRQLKMKGQETESLSAQLPSKQKWVVDLEKEVKKKGTYLTPTAEKSAFLEQMNEVRKMHQMQNEMGDPSVPNDTYSWQQAVRTALRTHKQKPTYVHAYRRKTRRVSKSRSYGAVIKRLDRMQQSLDDHHVRLSRVEEILKSQTHP